MSDDRQATAGQSDPGEPQPHEPLPLKIRIVLFIIGWALVGIGILGLALPGIQGILTIVLGLAVLSLVSESFYHLMHWLFGRWPRLWTRIDGWRTKLHRRLAPKKYRADG